jgi:hypothetical protein
MPRVALEAPEDGQVDENLFVRHRMHYVTVPVMAVRSDLRLIAEMFSRIVIARQIPEAIAGT